MTDSPEAAPRTATVADARALDEIALNAIRYRAGEGHGFAVEDRAWLLRYIDRLAQPATPVGALDAYDIRIVVRALFTSGLTDDMNPVDRRKAGIRLQGTLRKQRDALAAASEPAGGGEG